ncbi:MAG: T9SS type A sorting domain-containing protein [Bacteroidota bacterium]|jgi:hypothetical protein
MKHKLISTFCLLLVNFGFTFSQSTWIPEICLVTVDSATSTYVSVIWNKPPATDIDSFYIYRADSNQVNYSKVGSVSFADSSVFDDINVNVNNTWYSYMLSSVDTNGVESLKSDTANTCLLNVVPNIQGGFFKCIWNKYNNGSNTATLVRCMWDSLGNSASLSQIGVNWAPTLTSWNHTGFSQAAQSVYRLEVEVGNACSPERGIINTTRSNVKNVANPLSLSDNFIKLGEKLTRVYPSPACNQISVEWNSAMEISKVILLDASCRVIESQFIDLSCLQTKFDVSALSSGIYFVELLGKNGKITKRITKQ